MTEVRSQLTHGSICVESALSTIESSSRLIGRKMGTTKVSTNQTTGPTSKRNHGEDEDDFDNQWEVREGIQQAA